MKMVVVLERISRSTLRAVNTAVNDSVASIALLSRIVNGVHTWVSSVPIIMSVAETTKSTPAVRVRGKGAIA